MESLGLKFYLVKKQTMHNLALLEGSIMALPPTNNNSSFVPTGKEVFTSQPVKANNSLTKSLVQNLTTHCGMGYIVSGFNPVGAAAGLVTGTLSTITGVGVSTLMNNALPEHKGTFAAI